MIDCLEWLTQRSVKSLPASRHSRSNPSGPAFTFFPDHGLSGSDPLGRVTGISDFRRADPLPIQVSDLPTYRPSEFFPVPRPSASHVHGPYQCRLRQAVEGCDCGQSFPNGAPRRWLPIMNRYRAIGVSTIPRWIRYGWIVAEGCGLLRLHEIVLYVRPRTIAGAMVVAGARDVVLGCGVNLWHPFLT